MHSLCIRRAYRIHSIHPLSIRLFRYLSALKFSLDNPFGVVVLLYPLSSTKIPFFIFLTSLLHISLFYFILKFSKIFSILGADEKDDANSEMLVVHWALFPYACVHRSVGPGLYVWSQMKRIVVFHIPYFQTLRRVKSEVFGEPYAHKFFPDY